MPIAKGHDVVALLEDGRDQSSAAVAAADDRDVQFAVGRAVDARREDLRESERAEAGGGGLEERAAGERAGGFDGVGDRSEAKRIAPGNDSPGRSGPQSEGGMNPPITGAAGAVAPRVGQSLEWLPSQSAPLALCLQPQK